MRRLAASAVVCFLAASAVWAGDLAGVTIPDDTVLLRGSGFVKTWRIRNSGTCSWPAGTTWIFVSGQQMAGPDAVPVPTTRPGETTDVSVNLIAPGTPGTYTGYWTLRFPDGSVLDKRERGG